MIRIDINYIINTESYLINSTFMFFLIGEHEHLKSVYLYLIGLNNSILDFIFYF